MRKIIIIILAMVLIIGISPYKKVEAVDGPDSWVESPNDTYPRNNQGAVDDERVEINPLIEIKFKHKVDLIDKSKIKLSSDGITYAVDLSQDTWITYDGYTLKIDINSLHRGDENLLRKNAAYQLTLGEGALRKRDPIGEYSKEMNLYFITGLKPKESDEGLVVEGYTSTPVNPLDNITRIEETNLGVDASIYIHFNREIKWNKWTSNPKVESNEEALAYFKLYKSPKTYKTSLDPNNKLYDSEFRYDINGRSIPIEKEEIEIESVEILQNDDGSNKNILKITPKESLLPLNKYIIQLTKKDIITDDYEKTLLNDMNQEIWTAPILANKPEWDMDLISAEEIIENHKGPNKSYTIHGAPNYNGDIDEDKGKPIILYVDKEVIPNPHTLNPFTGIKMFEGYREGDTSLEEVKIKWYKIEYFYDEGDVKKSKISLYPEKELTTGRYYRVEIGKGVFKSRGNLDLEEISFDFSIDGYERTGKGIYIFELEGSSITLLISDFEPEKPDFKFKIKGYNFTEDIKQLRFVRVKDGKTIIVPKTDLEYHNSNLISGIIRGEAKEEFAKIKQGGKGEFTTTNAGIYDIFIEFETGGTASLNNIDKRIILKDRPKIIATTPRNGERYFDSERLKNLMDSDDEGYYIKIIFENIGGSLEIINQIESGITIYIEGENENWLDQSRDFKFTSSSDEFILYIPLKDKPADGQIYNITIPEGKVVMYNNIRGETNIAYEFTFDTNYLPKAKELYEGSVPEFYDYNYPIVIDGTSFRRDTRVRFKGMDGRIYNADGIMITRENDRLYIFLPRYPRLPVGLYDIIISNGYNYNTEMIYGVFSVVEQGDYIPNEEYRVRDESEIGVLKEIIRTSRDTLEVKEKNITKDKLEIDLDELMGEEVWVRTIEYPAKRSDYLGELILKSRWANINIIKVRLQEDPNENKIKLRGGRVEPSVSDIIKRQIVNNNVKSNFIEISGKNFDFDNITIEIPYFESDGIGLKMLRYDENTRRFEEVKVIRDLVERKLRGFSKEPGIFVIVD